MIENIKQMRQRHEKEIAHLQKLCKHKEHSRMPYMWAIEHFGNDVEICNWCGKTLKQYDTNDKVQEMFKPPVINNDNISEIAEAFDKVRGK